MTKSSKTLTAVIYDCIKITVEVTDSNKHNSLLCWAINYNSKSFDKKNPQWPQKLQIFMAVTYDRRKTTAEATDSDKHTNLLGQGIDYDLKRGHGNYSCKLRLQQNKLGQHLTH